MTIKDVPWNIILNLCNNGGEVTLNDIFCNVLNAYLPEEYEIILRKKFGKGFPDCIIYKNGIPNIMFEFKLTKQSSTLKRSICQMFCEIYNKYKNTIIPFKHLVVCTEKNVYLFDWNDEMELIYDNFILYYKGETPTTYWDNCGCNVKILFNNINEFIIDNINLQDIDFEYFSNKLCA